MDRSVVVQELLGSGDEHDHSLVPHVTFRDRLYHRVLGRRKNTLFELLDALVMGDSPCHSCATV